MDTSRIWGLMLFALPAACGGALSEGEYAALEVDVAERNEARRRAAIEALGAEGWTLSNAHVLYATLPPADEERCRDFLNGSGAEAVETTVALVRPAPEGGPSEPAGELSADLGEACALLFQRTARLSGTREGAPAELVQGGALVFAERLDGRRALVDVVFIDVSERTVLVERTCNEMPSPPIVPERLAPHPVTFAPLPAERVEMVVEREVIEMECTDVVE